jgi:type III pantothenate kinase
MKRKILAIDCGNSNIKWALFDILVVGARPQIVQSGIFATSEINQHLSLLVAKVCMSATGLQQAQTLQVMIANVAGDAVAGALKCAFSTQAVSLCFVQAQFEACGIRNGYEQPQSLGVDRFAALVAAHQQPQNQLLVMAGTALTIDALDAQGNFLGGLIAPGLRTMQQALHQRTAQLPQVNGDGKLIHTFPTSTATAIASGAMQACIGAVMMQALAYENRLSAIGERLMRIVVAGGAAPVLLPQLEGAIAMMSSCYLESKQGAAGAVRIPALVIQPDLVIEGLYCLASAAPTALAV